MVHNHTSFNPRRLVPPRRKPVGRLVPALAAVASLVAMSACGSSDGKASDIASVEDIDGVGTTTAGSTPTSTSDDNDVVFADYEQCMADEGVDLPKLDDNGGNEVDGGAVPDVDLSDIDNEALQAASEKCAYILEEIDSPLDDLTPEQQAALDDFLVKMEKCLSDKGYDVPLAQTAGNPLDGENAADMTLPADFDWEGFDKAGQECEDEVGIPSELEDLEDF